ncbi:MAG: helix-turn-helix domain-containing protein [Flavonifractor plautii]
MFDFQQISRYRENNRLEAKLATGGLPRSIWETYSAFANTYGGVILLGVEELPDHTLRVQGLLEPRELVDEFTALLQNPRVVSTNLLTPGDIQVLHVDGGDIVAITVPPASRTSARSTSAATWPAAPTAAAATGTTTVPGGAQRHAGRPLPLTADPGHPVAGVCQICASASSRIWLHSSGRSRKGRCPAFGRERNALQGADRVS